MCSAAFDFVDGSSSSVGCVSMVRLELRCREELLRLVAAAAIFLGDDDRFGLVASWLSSCVASAIFVLLLLRFPGSDGRL